MFKTQKTKRDPESGTIIELIEDIDFEGEQQAYRDKKKENAFLFKSKKFFLTYPKFDIDPEKFFKIFQKTIQENKNQLTVTTAIVSREFHNETEGKHIHIWGVFNHKLETRNPRFFDIEDHHPHIENPKDSIRCVKYVAGYTKQKENDEKDLYSYNMNINNYLNEIYTRSKKGENEKKLINNEIYLYQWVDENPMNIYRLGTMEKNLNIYHNDKANEYRQENLIDRTCFWIYGKKGIGKTYSILSNYLATDLYRKDSSKWWNGYTNQQIVLMDDLDNKNMFNEIKIWSDKYIFQGETKGGYTKIFNRIFIVTSNYTIKELFWKKNSIGGFDDDDILSKQLIPAIERRFFIIKAEDYLDLNDKFNFFKVLDEYKEQISPENLKILNNTLVIIEL